MAINIERAVDFAVTYLSDMNDIDENKIDDFVDKQMNKLLDILYKEKANEIEKTKIKKIIKTRLSHYVLKTDSVLTSNDFKSWFKKDKEKFDFKYWHRYSKYLEYNKHFSKRIIENIDDVTDEITDLLGNPQDLSEFQRRGLIIGDVQSGKTANFIGLMSKACDVGYKLIVVLAGTEEKLRTQTQSRIDEGLLGTDSDKKLFGEFERIGCAKYSDDAFSAVNVTSKSRDFKKDIANTLGLKLNQTQEPIIFVIKKNVTVLKNLNSWIKSLNQTNENGKIDSSLLLIDDEADYASINTNKPENDPTKTNERIVELLSLFSKNSYIGFTATPYANIFIDPDSEDEMGNSNLFPKDYIYCLDSPTNYTGARNIFNDEPSQLLKTIESFDESINDEYSIHNILPISHKKDANFDEVPSTLKEAILEFYLGNTIRDLWRDTKSHRTMMINISTFVNVHEKIRYTVNKYINSLSRSIILNSKLENGLWQNDPYMMNLYNIYNSEFKKICEDKQYAENNTHDIVTWDNIREHLYESTAEIVIRVVNQKSKDSFDYDMHKDGLRVIAIGGIGLSRGLTLEGLMVSYFFRNSIAYDTLMQMGRWFGYREGYLDLCRIWMTDEMQECYYAINRATEELRESIILYKNSGLTPMDFGIKVRTDNNLLITARNKMRTAKEELMECTLSSKIIETPFLASNKETIACNFNTTISFIKQLMLQKSLTCNKAISSAIGFLNVSFENITKYIEKLYLPQANLEYQNHALVTFIKENKDKLSLWDVALIQGNGENIDLTTGNIVNSNKGNYISKMCNREIDIKPNTELIRISGKRRRVGGPSDGLFGLEKKIDAKSQIACFDTENRRPLLCIYFIEPRITEKNINNEERLDLAKHVIEISKITPLVSISVGIPNLGKKEKYIKYAINKIEQGLKQLQFDFEGIENDDD